MKTIVAGSRDIKDFDTVKKAIDKSGFKITEIVSGTAIGVDQIGEVWAKKNKITVKRFPANWELYGKSAGYIRNSEMAKYADALIAVWDGSSYGTRNMIDEARKKGLEVFVYTKGEDDDKDKEL